MNCIHCHTPITGLNSQKNGNLDTCKNCAIKQADKLHYTLKRKQEVVVDEVICQRHYQEELAAGSIMGPLTDRELANGYVQTVVPYTGDHDCKTCESNAVEVHELRHEEERRVGR